MKLQIFLSALLATAVMLPTGARADKWYNEPAVWGGAGLVTGGVVGYVIGRNTGRRNDYPDRGYYVSRPAAPVYYDSYAGYPHPVHMTGGNYYREKWAFPFYHKIESYPIASTMPLVTQPQSVSMANRYSEPPRNVYSAEELGLGENKQEPMSIQLGDNNSNITINVNGRDISAEDRPVLRTEPVVNNAKTVGPNRIVDMTVIDNGTTRTTPKSAPAKTEASENAEAKPAEESTTH